MPNRTVSSQPAQRAGADREAPGGEDRNKGTGDGTVLARKTGAAHDGADPQAPQPEPRRLNLTTPPADHRIMKGRY
ncbi:hypothetical protein [Microvirga sp. M2]|uniref:hypothetical protein n=1 Tax=Microvirga sp. M2 TaxID=3073270 RepID=UPI0039C1BAE7